ncbi:hypothetical protein [Caloramator sp. E03]|uniref:hypothetical protein n=1 Tax=Caloramator sp. E03 TaxID=2576307 RepID=UPI00143D8AC2|nr:hypothetical protein [Caloramator sp. E03]
MNILLFLLSVITFGAIFKSGYEFYKFNKDVSVLKPKWNNIETAQTKKYEIIRDWYENDRNHFKELLGSHSSMKDTIYKEYISLNKKLYEIDKLAYYDSKGYTLYSPELTEAYCALISAAKAREMLLYDITCGKVKDLNSYYSENLYYIINNKSTSQDKLIDIDKNFESYNQQKIIDTLSNLHLPDHFYYGLKIFFVNAHTKTELGFFNRNSMGENNFIVVYNQPTEEMIHTTIHEFGHLVENKILYEFKKNKDGFLINEENKQAMLEYAKIYNKTSYYTNYDDYSLEKWGNSLNENFAEDFASLYDLSPKDTLWQGDHKKEVEYFIQRKIANKYINNFPLIKSAKITSPDNSSEITLPFNMDCNFYTKSSKVNIKLDILPIKGKNIKVSVYSDDYYNCIPINSKNEATITLPKKGQYDIYIESSASDNSLGTMVHCSNFKIVYDSN